MTSHFFHSSQTFSTSHPSIPIHRFIACTRNLRWNVRALMTTDKTMNFSVTKVSVCLKQNARRKKNVEEAKWIHRKISTVRLKIWDLNIFLFSSVFFFFFFLFILRSWMISCFDLRNREKNSDGSRSCCFSFADLKHHHLIKSFPEINIKSIETGRWTKRLILLILVY